MSHEKGTGPMARPRKMLLNDVNKAHLNSECTEDVFIELPEEVVAAQHKIGKLRVHGFRPAAAAWKVHHANKLDKLEEGRFRERVGDARISPLQREGLQFGGARR